MPDYSFTQADNPPVTPIPRWEANIAAIRIAKELESDGRRATPDEQRVLASYSGFGDSAFNQGFHSYTRDEAWRRRGEELREVTTPEEYEAIEKSRLTAYYTTPEVVDAMWAGLRAMGADKLDNPTVLEPSAGSGRFLGMQPQVMAVKSNRTAVELDKLTGTILKHAYPDTKVINSGYQDAPIPDDSVDIAISNVPFGNRGVVDHSRKAFLTKSIHNYFFAKTMDKLKPGGVMAFVTTHHTMDAPRAQGVREKSRCLTRESSRRCP